MCKNDMLQSISKYYFDIDLPYTNIHFIKNDKDLMYNNVISKKEAIDVAYTLLKEFFTNDSVLYVSNNALKAKEVMNIMNNNLIERHAPQIAQNTNGWLFFLDKQKFANWQHDCTYLFVIDNKMYICFDEKTPPCNYIIMEIIK